MQPELPRAAYSVQREIESGQRPLVGVNVNVEEEGPLRIGLPDYSALERIQRETLATRKLGRDGHAVQGALERIREAARGSVNLMPPIIDAVKAAATLGEISDALRSEWGVYDG